MAKVEIVADLRDCPRSGLFYGGEAGRKEGVLINGEPWIIKYPYGAARDCDNGCSFSHVTDPVSEHVGAKIFASLGIPTHETMLGYRNGKIVCACKDFTFPDKRLFEFKDIKNALSDDDEGFQSAPSDGESIYLADVLAAIETSDVLQSVPGVLERFWDMFVVDAFIKNPDRNNGNWGLIMSGFGQYELAPVYDLGSSLFSKRSASLTEERLHQPGLVEEDAFATNVSCYRLVGMDGKSVAIHPFDYMRTSMNPDLQAAIRRFAEALNMDAVDAIIDAIPEEAYGHILMSEAVRASHKELLHTRYEQGILLLL